MIILQKDFQLSGFFLLSFANISDNEKEMVRGWRNHSETRKWMFSEHFITKKEHNGFLKKLNKESRNAFWVVKSDEYDYIGVIYLNRIDYTNKNSYLGLYANPDFRYVGAGHHLLKCLKELAFDKLNLHTLKLEVLRDNKKARKLYEKSGFAEEGTLREFIRRADGWKDVIVMGLLNSEVR